MVNLLVIGERLREERERLGYSQTEFGELVDKTRKSIAGYEGGKRAPDIADLLTWGEYRLDVVYVLYGAPSTPENFARATDKKAGDFARENDWTVDDQRRWQEERGIDVPDELALAPDEQLLLDAYRDMKPAKRKALLAELLTGKKPGKSGRSITVKGSNQRVAGRDYHENDK